MIIKATKKPVTIECVKWDGENIEEIMAFCGASAFSAVESQMGQTETEELYISTLEGNHHASVGDYIIKGVKGEFYPCKPDIFENTYDIVDESGPIVKEALAMDDLIYEHKYDDGNKALVVVFGEGGIGIGLGQEKPDLNIHLQELKKLKKMGEFLTNEEIMDNFKNPKNPSEVILHFPTEESITNFIETLNIYKDTFFKQ